MASTAVELLSEVLTRPKLGDTQTALSLLPGTASCELHYTASVRPRSLVPRPTGGVSSTWGPWYENNRITNKDWIVPAKWEFAGKLLSQSAWKFI